MEAVQSASREPVRGIWPRYDAAALGFRNYWYPVLLSRQVGRKPRAIRLCGEKIVLVRDAGRIYGLHDRCPHRGVPLSCGRREFPGMLTCAYHGWTYDLATGRLEVVLTDGPDSPICGKANVRTYPVEERAGVVWVYVGEAPPPPVEADIPEELLRDDAVIEGLVEIRRGNWRYACENSVDEGHAKYLHRKTPWTYFSEFPAWTRGVRMAPSEDGQWLMRHREQSVFEDDYPRVGRWPPKRAWQSRNRGPSLSLGIRLPGVLRVVMRDWTDYEFFVPVDAHRHRALFLAVKFARGAPAALFRARFRSYIRPLYYGLLNRGQDQWMIEQMQTPPERLYRPDGSVTAWRKWCQEKARGDDDGAHALPSTGSRAAGAPGGAGSVRAAAVTAD
jgi:phenylpropionate dioxygenase-like ring-hydroxylating dioxygenase large terminal subunit